MFQAITQRNRTGETHRLRELDTISMTTSARATPTKLIADRVMTTTTNWPKARRIHRLAFLASIASAIAAMIPIPATTPQLLFHQNTP